MPERVIPEKFTDLFDQKVFAHLATLIPARIRCVSMRARCASSLRNLLRIPVVDSLSS